MEILNNKSLKIALVLLLTTILIVISTWIFLKSSIKGEFDEASYNLNCEIIKMVNPVSGKTLMDKYIIKSERIINKHIKVPLLPLLNKSEKNGIIKEVLNEIKAFRVKLGKLKGVDVKQSNQLFLSTIRNFQSAFPYFQISGKEMKKLTSPIVTAKQRFKKVPSNTVPKLSIAKKSDVKSVPDKKSSGKPEKNSKRKNNIKVAKKKKGNLFVSYENVPVGKIGKHLNENVRIYLKIGRSLKGIIKSVNGKYLSLLVSIKGGTYTARIIIEEIDKVVKIIHHNPFFLIEE